MATLLKFGDRTPLGAAHLATSLVADLQLVVASGVWIFAAHVSADGLDRGSTATVVSLAAGALVANMVSAVLLMIETVSFHRR